MHTAQTCYTNKAGTAESSRCIMHTEPRPTA